MTRHRVLSLIAVLTFGAVVYSVALAVVDCSKIRAYRCPIATGGNIIKGLPGAVLPGGTPVNVKDLAGNTAGPVPSNADGSFAMTALNITLPAPPAIVTLIINGDTCRVQVLPCP